MMFIPAMLHGIKTRIACRVGIIEKIRQHALPLQLDIGVCLLQHGWNIVDRNDPPGAQELDLFGNKTGRNPFHCPTGGQIAESIYEPFVACGVLQETPAQPVGILRRVLLLKGAVPLSIAGSIHEMLVKGIHSGSPMDKALLDTDIFSEILKGKDPQVAAEAKCRE